MIKRDPFGNVDGDFVINGLDCQPRNKKRHMVFVKKSGVSFVDSPKDSHHVTSKEMSPDEYLDTTYLLHKKNTFESGRPWQYEDKEDYLNQNTSKLRVAEYKEKIASPDKTMDSPWLETEGGVVREQEGRHRMMAARELGIPKVNVNMVETDSRYLSKTLPDSWVDKQAKRSVERYGDLDEQGYCAGNCQKISERVARYIPDSKVVRSIPSDYIGAQHRAVLLPNNKIVDTQVWQYKEKKPTDLESRKVVFTKDEYEKEGFSLDKE
jgi:hypothetical protein